MADITATVSGKPVPLETDNIAAAIADLKPHPRRSRLISVFRNHRRQTPAFPSNIGLSDRIARQQIHHLLSCSIDGTIGGWTFKVDLADVRENVK